MKRDLRVLLAAGAALTAMIVAGAALAQKQGGILQMYSPDSPASMSIHEEATVFAEGPMMGVFNNLVMFDQHVPQNSLQSVVPDRATGWSWSEEGTELTLPLREGVTWHDGKPFTARDVQCTFDMLAGTSSESSASILANPGTATSSELPRTATTRSPSI
jgi:peptide/nickel transport system substrate-binding protein